MRTFECASKLAHSIIAVGLTMSAAAQETSVAHGSRGAIAAAHPAAAEAGLEMLRAGGNAVDAAAAIAFTLAVVEPFGSGLGGGGVSLVRMAASEEAVVYSYRDVAPALATYASVDFELLPQWEYSAFAALVPGLVSGVLEMHEAHGRLPRAQVMAPSITAARDGFEAGPTLCSIIADSYDMLAQDDEAAALFLPDLLPPEPGQILRNPELAVVLSAIASEGASAFYTGQVAQALADGLEMKGGLIRVEDLAAFETIVERPVTDTYRGLTLETSPPPFTGVAVLEALSILEQFDLAEMAYPSEGSIALFAEAMWTASRDYRREIGDPRFVMVDTAPMLSDDFAQQTADAIRVSHAELLEGQPVAFALDENDNAHGSTTHFSVIDAEGNAVSQTQTLGAFFGCGAVAPGTGVIFNNQLKNYSTSAGRPNSLGPGRRPRSTQSPTIVTREGELVGAIGSPGNFRIVTTVPLVISLMVDFGMSPEEAISAPRIAIRHRSSAPDERDPLELEGGIPPEIGASLQEAGFRVQTFESLDLHFGGVHLVWIDSETGERTAAADPRRDGIAVTE